VGHCAPVKGTVILGTKPLNGGSITLIAVEGDGQRPRPEGTIDAEGHYTLKTAGSEGAPPGKYRVAITTSGADKAQDSQFNPQYSHWDKSPLTIQVSDNPPPGAYDLKLVPR
jgi:hypothetical protein